MDRIHPRMRMKEMNNSVIKLHDRYIGSELTSFLLSDKLSSIA